MDLDQLTAALAGHDADPETVMAAFRRKWHRRARNRYLSLGAVAVAAVAGLTAAFLPRAATPRSMTTASSGQAVSGTALTDGCAQIPLRERLADARSAGASVIVGRGLLTGRTAAGYDAMTLRSVQTLAGPPIASGSTAWVTAGSSAATGDASAGALWAPDGRLFAIAWPRPVTHSAVGPALVVAPVVNGQVIFSVSGCWDTTGLPVKPFHGPLAQTPGSKSYAIAVQHGGFTAVPLTTVEQLVKGR